jgi:hypothetical protein
MIYRGPGFRDVSIRVLPYPFSHQQFVFFSQTFCLYCRSLVELTDGSRSVGEEPNYMTARKPSHL